MPIKAKDICNNLRLVSDIKVLKKELYDFLRDHYRHNTVNPYTAEQNLEIGLSLQEIGENMDLIAPYYEKAINQTRDAIIRAECYYGLAVVARQKKYDDVALQEETVLNNFELSIDEINKCEHVNPDEYFRIKSNILRNRGIFYLSKDEFRAALHDFKQSAKLAKESVLLEGFLPAVQAYIALTLGKLQRYKESNAAFEEAYNLYRQFDVKKLVQSNDFFSFFVHLTRTFEARGHDDVNAEKIAKFAYELRNSNLRTEEGKLEGYYANSRVGAIAGLLEKISNRKANTQGAENAAFADSAFMQRLITVEIPMLEAVLRQTVVAVVQVTSLTASVTSSGGSPVFTAPVVNDVQRVEERATTAKTM